MSVYNPTIERNYIFRVKIPRMNVQVTDYNNNALPTDVFCVNITDIEDCDLYFESKLEAYSFSFFKIAPYNEYNSNEKVNFTGNY